MNNSTSVQSGKRLDFMVEALCELTTTEDDSVATILLDALTADVARMETVIMGAITNPCLDLLVESFLATDNGTQELRNILLEALLYEEEIHQWDEEIENMLADISHQCDDKNENNCRPLKKNQRIPACKCAHEFIEQKSVKTEWAHRALKKFRDHKHDFYKCVENVGEEAALKFFGALFLAGAKGRYIPKDFPKNESFKGFCLPTLVALFKDKEGGNIFYAWLVTNEKGFGPSALVRENFIDTKKAVFLRTAVLQGILCYEMNLKQENYDNKGTQSSSDLDLKARVDEITKTIDKLHGGLLHWQEWDQATTYLQDAVNFFYRPGENNPPHICAIGNPFEGNYCTNLKLTPTTPTFFYFMVRKNLQQALDKIFQSCFHLTENMLLFVAKRANTEEGNPEVNEMVESLDCAMAIKCFQEIQSQLVAFFPDNEIAYIEVWYGQNKEQLTSTAIPDLSEQALNSGYREDDFCTMLVPLKDDGMLANMESQELPVCLFVPIWHAIVCKQTSLMTSIRTSFSFNPYIRVSYTFVEKHQHEGRRSKRKKRTVTAKDEKRGLWRDSGGKALKAFLNNLAL